MYGINFNRMPESRWVLGYLLALPLVLVASVRRAPRRPLVLLIKGEIELQHHVQSYTSEAQYPGAPVEGVGIRQR